MSIKRTIIVTAAILASVAMVAPSFAGADTISDLMAQIAALQSQLLALQGQTTTTTSGTGLCAGVTFTRNLTVGSTGSDVKCLQQILSVTPTSGYFGPKTLAAVRAYQTAQGLTPANQVGPLTRAKLNASLGTTGGTTPVVNPTAGGLSVGLAYDTPASANVAATGSANFTKFNLTAGTGNVNISRLYVTRTGLTANADLSNVMVVDAVTGAYVGNVGSLNTDNRALIVFVPSLTINAGTTRSFYIRASVVSGTSAGKTAALGVAAADIQSDATSVIGSATGNAMTVVSLTIGSASVTNDGSVSDSAPNVGTTDVIVNQFKVTAGSTEDITIKDMTAMRTGSASTTDVANIKLWDVTKGTLLGTVSAWDAYGKAVFSNLNLVVAKGGIERFKVTVDIVNGAGASKTVNADMIDGSTVLITVVGNTYGFYITPSATGSWNGLGGTGGTNTVNQTIASGSLTITTAASTPATGKVTAGSSVVLGKFDFNAQGEDIKVTAIKFLFTTTGLADSDVTQAALYDANGTIVAGPKDMASGETSFTDTFVIPVGVQTYTAKATIASSAALSETIKVGIKVPSSNITATGMLSNASITSGLSASTVNANVLTVGRGALTVTTLSNPASRSVPKGTSRFIFGTFALDASSAGENIQVTSIAVVDSLGNAAYGADIANAELWADVTSASSARGDVYETKLAVTKQPTGSTGNTTATTTFTISPTLTITKGTFVKVALVADLISSAQTSCHSFSITTGGVVANGASTGVALVDGTTTTYVTAGKQTMTAAASGTLTVSVDASTPIADIVLGGKTGVTVGVFRLSANNVEDLDLTQFSYNATGGTKVSTLYFYDGSTLLGTAPGANSGTVVFNTARTFVVPAGGYKLLTVKADVLPVDGTTVANAATLNFALEGASNVQMTGTLSGASVTNSLPYASNNMTIYRSRPYFAKNSSSPSGQISAISDYVPVAIFDVRADDADDITFIRGTQQLKFNVSATFTSSTSQKQMYFKLTDSDGVALDTGIEPADSNATANIATTVTFNFTGATNSTWTVPKGTTKQLTVWVDSRDFKAPTSGRTGTIQISAQASANNCKFGTNNGAGTYGGTAFAEGDKIFRNNIYANVLGGI